MKNHLFNFLDEVEGLPVGSTTANIEKEKKRQGYGGKRDLRKIELFVDGKYVATTTWAKTCSEAIERYKEEGGTDGKVTAHFKK